MNEETLNMSYEKKTRIYRCEVKILNNFLSDKPKPQRQKLWPSHSAEVDASAGLWLFQRTKIRDQNAFSSASESIKAIHTATSCRGSPWTWGHSNAGPTQLPQASPMSGLRFRWIIAVRLTKEKDMRGKHVYMCITKSYKYVISLYVSVSLKCSKILCKTPTQIQFQSSVLWPSSLPNSVPPNGPFLRRQAPLSSPDPRFGWLWEPTQALDTSQVVASGYVHQPQPRCWLLMSMGLFCGWLFVPNVCGCVKKM